MMQIGYCALANWGKWGSCYAYKCDLISESCSASDRQVTRADIPVAGLGKRMLPATKALSKEMPIVDKPLIQYVVQEAVAAGITEIILVTHLS